MTDEELRLLAVKIKGLSYYLGNEERDWIIGQIDYALQMRKSFESNI